MKALILSVTNADQITLLHNRGIQQNLTLAHILVPDTKGDLPLLGVDALNFIRNTVQGKVLNVTFTGLDQIEIHLPNGSCLNDLLVEESLAVYKGA
jgi:hypothetical protein